MTSLPPTFREAVLAAVAFEGAADQCSLLPLDQMNLGHPTCGKPRRGLGLVRYEACWDVPHRVADVLTGRCESLGYDGDVHMLVFRDYVVAVLRLSESSELRIVKTSAPGDVGLGLPDLARQAGDEWLSPNEAERRFSTATSPIRSELCDHLRDLIIAVPSAGVYSAKFSLISGFGIIRAALSRDTREMKFIAKTARHIIINTRLGE